MLIGANRKYGLPFCCQRLLKEIGINTVDDDADMIRRDSIVGDDAFSCSL